jgi:hypothetical protein
MASIWSEASVCVETEPFHFLHSHYTHFIYLAPPCSSPSTYPCSMPHSYMPHHHFHFISFLSDSRHLYIPTKGYCRLQHVRYEHSIVVAFVYKRLTAILPTTFSISLPCIHYYIYLHSVHVLSAASISTVQSWPYSRSYSSSYFSSYLLFFSVKNATFSFG